MSIEDFADPFLAPIVDGLKRIQGVKAVVLGGSRAKGSHHSGSDYDIGLYYDSESPPEIGELLRFAKDLDDRKQDHLLTPFGEWGPWINGGGWLRVKSMPVDILYRDMRKVRAVLDECLRGDVSIFYQPGHPHGFVNAIYFAEVALGKTLWEEDSAISDFKVKTAQYPENLKKGLIQKFLWEAEFALEGAKKGLPYSDISYIAGCFFRTVSCLNQVIYALNERYWTNEKGAVKAAPLSSICPAGYEARINEAFSRLEPSRKLLQSRIKSLGELVAETALLAQKQA